MFMWFVSEGRRSPDIGKPSKIGRVGKEEKEGNFSNKAQNIRFMHVQFKCT